MLALIALFITQDALTPRLDELAKRRDVAALTAMVAPGAWEGRNPLEVIRTNGAYETGKFGWSAVSGEGPDGKKYTVLTTPLTSEDVGERLFETDGQQLTKYIDERQDFGWRIAQHGMTVTFDIPNKKVKILDAIDVKSEGKSDLLMLRLGPNYRLSSLKKFIGEGIKWTQLGGIVMVMGAKDGDKLMLDYTGVVDKPGYAGSITPNEAMLTNDYWYPMIGRKPSPFAMIIRGPADWTAITHGELITSEVQNGVRMTMYGMEMPISYWSLNIAPYKTVEEKIEGKTYKVWSKVLSDQQMKLQPKFFPKIIETYEQFAKFPFSGYGSCVSPLYGGGALEGYSFVTSGYYSGEDSHEVGHTWFGGMVSNTYLTSMWNESFAVWCQGFYSRNVKIGNQAERERAFVMTPAVDEVGYFTAPLNDAPPDIGPVASELGYGKGAFVLQMLEQELGTATMVKACREWIASQDTTKGAEWEGFEAAVKKVSPKDMTWFFDQWVRRPGFAQFQIQNVRYADGKVTGTVTTKGAPYRITCDVNLVGPWGTRATKVELLNGAFSIPCEGKPTLVSFDPWRRIVRKIDENEHPASLSSELGKFKRANSLQAEGMLDGVGRKAQAMPTGSLNGWFLVGSPELDIRLKPLFDKVGFVVKGSVLIYKGTKINLKSGGAVALVDLTGGGQCAIGIGNIQHHPDFGRARLAVFDELGRFVRGVTEPKTQGALTFKL